MHLETPFRADWEVSNDLSLEQVGTILSQPFTYLNRGAQCYVFASKDKKYVIKFFRFDRAKKRAFDQKVNALFSACTLAYNKAKEETGVLYLHLNKTEGKFPLLTMTGPLGQTVSLHPDAYRFVIQKRASSFQESIFKASPEAIQRRLDSFLSLLQSRLGKGLRNSDPEIIRNFGFIEDQAVEIDFGNYSERPTPKEKEFSQVTERLRAWLKENAPESMAYFDEKVKRA